MEKNKKVVKNYVVCYGGSRNELEEVCVVSSERSMEECLKELGEKRIESMLEDYDDSVFIKGVIEDFSIGVVSKMEKRVDGFEVYSMSLGEEESVFIFEGGEEIVNDLDEVEDLGELFEYLGID